MSVVDKNSRILYFLIGCIGIRVCLAITPVYLPERWLPYFGLITLTIASSLLYLYFTNSRLKAPEGGGITWWAQYRLVHGMLYLAASIYLLQGKRTAWIPLTIDVCFGLLLFLHKHNFIL